MVPHLDADGLSAGVLMARRTGGPMLHVSTPWDEPLPVAGPAVIVDWGVRPVTGPDPVLYVDHHAAPEPVDATTFLPEPASGETSTSLLVWELLGRPEHSAWLAALGAVGDLGEKGAAAAGAPSVSNKAALKRLVALVNAPGRLRDGPVAEAGELLLGAESARGALASPKIAPLESAKGEVNAARERAIRTPPKVGPDAALLRFSEPARVHALVAQAWSRRLAPKVVVAANEGWRDGKVSFAVRSADGRDLRAWLGERFTPPPGAGDYGRGHARATGGSLVPDAFEEFAEAVLS